jgi:8-oxo-dGTP pyrophosphatase MutT (NUDIX family)
MIGEGHPHLDLTQILRPGDGVGALLLLDDGRYLLQRRDCIPGIFFPDHWGCFGGAIDPGETAEQALVRELAEETGLDADLLPVRYFSRCDFDLSFAGCGQIFRTFFEVQVSDEALSHARLGEGKEMRAFSAAEVLSLSPITPYDGFGLWMHINQGRLRPAV